MTGGSAQRHGTLRPCEKSQATISLRSKGRFANYVRPMIPRLYHARLSYPPIADM